MDNMPRILTNCGHSICHHCIETLYNQKQIKCPLCGKQSQADLLYLFTKNLALLQSDPKPSQPPSVDTSYHIKDTMNQSLMSTKGGFSMPQSSICFEHQRLKEAYCWTCQITLCIDCIIMQSTHKAHEVQNIEQSLEKEESKLGKIQDRLTHNKMKIAKSQTYIKQFKADLEAFASEQITQIGKFFEDLRDIVEHRLKQARSIMIDVIENRARWAVSKEQKLKDLMTEITTIDFQLLSAQLGYHSKLEQLTQQIDKENIANGINQQAEELVVEPQILEEFDFNDEIAWLMKAVQKLTFSYCDNIYTETMLQQSPKLPVRGSKVNTSMQMNNSDLKRRPSHRELNSSQIQRRQSTSQNKDKSTSRRKEYPQPKSQLNLSQTSTAIPLKSIKAQTTMKALVGKVLKTQLTARQTSQSFHQKKSIMIQHQRTNSRQSIHDQSQDYMTPGNRMHKKLENIKQQKMVQTARMVKSEYKHHRRINNNNELSFVSACKVVKQQHAAYNSNLNQSVSVSKALEQLNHSVDESENEDEASYTSIHRMVAEKQLITSSQKSLLNQTTDGKMQSTRSKQNEDQDQTQPYAYVSQFEELKTITENSLTREPSKSFRQPNFREKRLNVKQEKSVSLKHQIEKQQWSSRQQQNVESISLQRQLSITKNIPINQLEQQYSSRIEQQYSSRVASSQVQISSINQVTTEKSLNQTYHSNFEVDEEEQQSVSSIPEISFNKFNIERINQTQKQQDHDSCFNIIDELQQLSNITSQLGLIRHDDHKLAIDIYCSQNKSVIETLQFAKHLDRTHCKFISDPRNADHILIMGGLQVNSLVSKVQVLNMKIQKFGDSDVKDLPFDDHTNFTCASGIYSTKYQSLPMLITAHSDSMDLVHLYFYLFEQQEWAQIPDPPVQTLSEFKLCVHANSLYLIAPESSARFDFKAQTWEVLDGISQRSQYAVVQSTEGIMVIGGHDNSEALKSCVRYNTTTHKWDSISDMNEARLNGQALEMDGRVYVYGGVNEQGQLLSSVEEYESEKDTWTVVIDNGISSKKSNQSIIKITL